MAAKKPSSELKITRIYEAPVKTVWNAFTEPAQVAQWWGPRGFTLTTHSKDLKNGGHWHYTMHGPDGTDYPNKTVYHEVEPYRRLLYDHGANDNQPPLFRVDVIFTELSKNRTQMDMRMILATPEIAEQTKQFIKKAGGNSTWDRLAEYLETSGGGNENFVINRSFEAPIDVVFDMWTQPEHFSKWLGPVGVNMNFIRADIRPGGTSFWSMSDGKDLKMFGHIHYQEIVRPNRIVYTQQFTDENENISRHPMAPTWPETMHTTVELHSEGEGETRVTVTWRPEGHITAAELEAFVKEKVGMTQGWSGSFDKLEELLSAK